MYYQVSDIKIYTIRIGLQHTSCDCRSFRGWEFENWSLQQLYDKFIYNTFTAVSNMKKSIHRTCIRLKVRLQSNNISKHKTNFPTWFHFNFYFPSLQVSSTQSSLVMNPLNYERCTHSVILITSEASKGLKKISVSSLLSSSWTLVKEEETIPAAC